MWGIQKEIWAAFIVATASVVVSLLGFWSARRTERVSRNNADELERLKATLADQSALRNARLDYEYDARKRLYTECGPLLFQLSELAERALGRIVGLARAAADGNLDPGPTSWLGRDYYNLSTYYRLLAPLAVQKLLQQRLTHIDLSLDPLIHWQYSLVKQLAESFTDDFDFARTKGHELEYRPHDEEAERRRRQEPVTYWQQGIPRGILDNAVTELILDDRGPRIMEFREFQDGVRRRSGKIHESYERISYVFEQFHPKTRPILWRVLLAQAHLHRAIMKARETGIIDPLVWDGLWDPDGRPNFDWRCAHEQEDMPKEQIEEPIQIGLEYARRAMSTLVSKLVTSHS